MKMSVGVVVGDNFKCSIRRRNATFKIWGGELRISNRVLEAALMHLVLKSTRGFLIAY